MGGAGGSGGVAGGAGSAGTAGAGGTGGASGAGGTGGSAGAAGTAGAAGAGPQTCVMPGTDLQGVLDAGEDLVLCPAQVYELTQALEYKADGQTIATHSAARTPLEFATLRIASAALPHAVYGLGRNDVVIERLVIDGNRGTFGSVSPTEGGLAMVFLGSAANQVARQLVLKNTRTWSNLQFHEGTGDCQGGLIEDNIVLWAGCDPRGNGCTPSDPPGRWGDGISMPCKQTTVRNNLVIDATDVGIVVFGAPGSTVTGNVVASVSRETLGGVALVDALDVYALSGSVANKDAVTDYRGDMIQNNDLMALGSRVHIGVGMGPPIWFGPTWSSARNRGAAVVGNRLHGSAFGYGFVSNGSLEARIEGNQSFATHGGQPDGVNGVAATTGPFLFDPATTVAPVALQPEFVASNQLTSLLRLYSCPKDAQGFWHCDYTEPEARAIVRLAYVEILGRLPDASGWDHYTGRLLNEHLSADALRRELMDSAEFKAHFPGVSSSTMQRHRQAVWERALFETVADAVNASGGWPAASTTFNNSLASLESGAGLP